jgi:8-oxo-dGTP diphosphatase
MSMAGKWEFPGGKVERDESPLEALRREVAEELGLEIAVGALVGRGTALHAGRRIVLDVYEARVAAGELRLVEHEEHGWFDAREIFALDWPEADLPILPELARRLATG